MRWNTEPMKSNEADLLQRALEIAIDGHRGQRQMDGLPYVLHPLELMGRVHSPAAKMAAVLHDVVEDTRYTIDDLEHEGFGADVLDAIRLLTHDDGSDYETYVEQIATNALATEVKLADLSHNMTITRIPKLRPKDLDRLAKYHKAHVRLTAAAVDHER